MNKEDLNEFIRRLKDEGLAFQSAPDAIGAVSKENGSGVTMEEDGSVSYNRGDRPFAMKVLGLYNQVREYMQAFRAAPQNPDKRAVQQVGDIRTLLLYNNCELAAHQFSNKDMWFITWRLDRDGSRVNGDYFSDYAQAKQDFAVRAELINRDMLFTEKELSVIRSSLSSYLNLENAYMTGKQENSIKEAIGKIDNIIVPEIHEKAEEAEELGYEPEQEL